nr:hypothetical protein [uncultured Roseateles sp.]
MTDRYPVTIVNHVAIDIKAPPEAVWRAIQEEYVEAKKFRQLGTLQPLDDPAAVLGGFRMRLEHEGVIDEREVRYTEIDHAARRLSVYADYLTVPVGGMGVWVTYQAQEVPEGTRYAIDAHARLHVEVQEGGGKADIATAIDALTHSFDGSLRAYLEKVKAGFEGVA